MSENVHRSALPKLSDTFLNCIKWETWRNTEEIFELEDQSVGQMNPKILGNLL